MMIMRNILIKQLKDSRAFLRIGDSFVIRPEASSRYMSVLKIRTVAKNRFPSLVVDRYPITLFLLSAVIATSIVSSETRCEEFVASMTSNSGDEVEKDSSEGVSDEEYEEKAKTCPFCRYFLESPCRESFKAWHTCVEVSFLPNAFLNSTAYNIFR